MLLFLVMKIMMYLDCTKCFVNLVSYKLKTEFGKDTVIHVDVKH